MRSPADDVTRVAPDGVRYLRPEIVLFFKARLQRSKDLRDFRLVAPLLDDRQRSWLRTAIASAWGDAHPWLTPLT